MLSGLLKNHKAVDVAKIRPANFIEAQLAVEKKKLARVNAMHGWKDVATCPVCGSSERSLEFVKHAVDLMRCEGCTLRYGSRIPADLGDIYNDPEYIVFTIDDTDEHFNYRRDRFGRERVGILERHCGDLTQKRILDIGCGNGYFLAAAQEKSRHCFGVDHSPRNREFVHRKTGATVYGEELDQLPAASFDIITNFDVIEHFPDPTVFMRSVDRLLVPGGHVLCFTPNVDSFSVRIMREYSSIVDGTEHVVLFTPESLRYVGKQVGFEVAFEETRGLDVASIVAMQKYLGQTPDPFLLQWGNELQVIVDASGCADFARILYKKPARG